MRLQHKLGLLLVDFRDGVEVRVVTHRCVRRLRANFLVNRAS